MSIDITTLVIAKEYINQMIGSGGTGSGDGSADGGHYIPTVTQPTSDTMQISFTPSKSDMPNVNPVTVILPVSDNSGQNADWNQNDLDHPGYIKNRPFFIETIADSADMAAEQETTFASGTATVTFAMTANDLYTRIQSEGPIAATLEIDGAQFPGTFTAGFGPQGTFGAYTITAYEGLNSKVLALKAGSGAEVQEGVPVTVCVFGVSTRTHPLDEAFIPDTIARVRDIPDPLPKIPAIANLTEAPTAEDFNSLLTALRFAGYMGTNV